MTDTSPLRRAPLDRAAVVDAGIALADEAGVDALTMRRLAERLGFKAMALYNHVSGKDELLALMADAIALEIDVEFDGSDPLTVIRDHAIATRRAFVAHPWAPEIWLRHVPGAARTDHMETILRAFDHSGLPADLAHHGFHAVTNHVLGYTLQENAMPIDIHSSDGMARATGFLETLSPDQHPSTAAHVQQHLDGENSSSFELVLDLILDGLSTRAATR